MDSVDRRHVYLEAIDSYKMSKSNATFVTFLFSSVLHEMVVAITAKRLLFIFFLSQMSQIPLIWVGRLPFFKRRPLIGNAFFWLSLLSGTPSLRQISLIIGMPLITILYTRELFYLQSNDQSLWKLSSWWNW